MNNLNFDTHKFVEDMVEAKMPKAQAEVLVNACVVWLNGSTATKNYLNNLEKRFGDNLEQSEQRLRVKQSEQRLGREDLNWCRRSRYSIDLKFSIFISANVIIVVMAWRLYRL